jgi:archaellum biogenesis protein FlaJ (TadC family)
MKKQLVGITMTVLIFVGILSADSTIVTSPVIMILFGVYLLGIVGYSRRKQEDKEYSLRKPTLHQPLQ